LVLCRALVKIIAEIFLLITSKGFYTPVTKKKNSKI
jgi:hypothetical protein